MALLPKTVTGPLPPHLTPLSSDHFETEPGARSALAPPFQFAGDRERYLQVIRQRYNSNPEVRQCIIIAALRKNHNPHGDEMEFRGPYAEWAREVIESTARRLREQKGEG
ncbi:MAG: hypothetical protein KBE53_01940 [Chromatiaceae bacterium]|nr:hypothetical protein [Chromatiaceae bacterium]